MLIQIVCTLALSCLNLLLVVTAAYFFLRRRSLKNKGPWLRVPVESYGESQAIDIPVHIEQLSMRATQEWLNTLMTSSRPRLMRAGLYVQNAEETLQSALHLREVSRRRNLVFPDEFCRNTYMSADLVDVHTNTVAADHALRRYYEVSNYALEQALAFQDENQQFAQGWQQLYEELVAFMTELEELVRERASTNDADEVGLIGYFESLGRDLSRRATRLKFEADVLVAYVDTITGLLSEARSLGEFVLSSANPAGEEQ